MSGRLDRAFRWPLWSWRNLTVTAAGALLLLTCVGRLTATSSAAPALAKNVATVAPSSASPGNAPPLSATTSSLPAPTSPPSPTTSSAPPPVNSQSVMSVATAFATAWARPDLSPEAWLRGVQPLVSASLAKDLDQTDPQRVPASSVTGEASLVSASGSEARVGVPTDSGRVLVTLSRQHGRWLVTDISPAGQPPAAATPNLGPTTSGTGG